MGGGFRGVALKLGISYVPLNTYQFQSRLDVLQHTDSFRMYRRLFHFER